MILVHPLTLSGLPLYSEDMNTTKTDPAVAELGEMIRPFLAEGEVTAESVADAVADAQESWERFFVRASLDARTGRYLAAHLADTYDEFRKGQR